MTAQEKLDEFDSAHPLLRLRSEALRQAYDKLCAHKYYCNAGNMPTSEAIDSAAMAIKNEMDQLQPLLTQLQALANNAYRERLGLPPKE